MKDNANIVVRLSKGKDGQWGVMISTSMVHDKTRYTLKSGKRIPASCDLGASLAAAGSVIQCHMLPRLQEMVPARVVKKAEGAS